MSEYVLVETVSMCRIRYVVKVPEGNSEWALDTVTMNEARESSQEHLDEIIVSNRTMTKDEVLNLLRTDNSYLSTWSDEFMLEKLVTEVDESGDVVNPDDM